MADTNPAPTAYFKITAEKMDGVGYFQSLDGLKSNIEAIVAKTVNAQGRPEQRSVPGQLKTPDVTIKRLADPEMKLWDWHKLAIDKGPEAARCDALIEQVDQLGATVAAFSLKLAWPKEYSFSQLSASGNEAGVEGVVIAFDEFERVAV